MNQWMQLLTAVGVGASLFFGYDAYRARRMQAAQAEDRYRLQIRTPEQQQAARDEYLDGVTWEDLLPPPVTLDPSWNLEPDIPPPLTLGGGGYPSGGYW